MEGALWSECTYYCSLELPLLAMCMATSCAMWLDGSLERGPMEVQPAIPIKPTSIYWSRRLKNIAGDATHLRSSHMQSCQLAGLFQQRFVTNLSIASFVCIVYHLLRTLGVGLAPVPLHTHMVYCMTFVAAKYFALSSLAAVAAHHRMAY